MSRVHGPVVAGTFYPNDPARLNRLVTDQLEAARSPAPAGRLVGLIVPHAGLIYSGPVAASAYRLLRTQPVGRVAVIGPSHFVWFEGMASLDADEWRTPLGSIPVERIDDEGCTPVPGAYASEHSIEVQLPFLQTVCEAVTILPLLVGDQRFQDVESVIERLAEQSVFLIISSDLSHYLDQRSAVAADTATVRNIVELRPDAIRRDDACGRIGVQAMVAVASKLGWRIEVLDRRTSADTAGSPDRVVGYGAFAVLA